jgi:serine/threonine-protein kinase
VSAAEATAGRHGDATVDRRALTATVGYGDVLPAPAPGVTPSRGATLRWDPAAATRAGTAAAEVRLTTTATAAPAGARTAVLPRATAASREDGAAAIPLDLARYERLRPLGEGGMGEVALARDHDIDRPVAIKRLRAEARTPGALLRFAEEVRAVGKLEHPGIVPIHDVGIDEEGQHFLVMKYVQGDTLEHVIDRLRAGDPAYLARYSHAYRAQIFAAVLEAVDYAHQQGFLHRDLKPANVIVGPHGEVTVMDWGLAKRVGAAERSAEPGAPASGRLLRTQQGAILGTPMYMAPEQAAGDPDAIDARADVDSLAVMFWELMSLRHPLEDKQSVEEILAALRDDEVSARWVGLTRIQSGALCEWGWFALEGMRRDPAARHASAGAMLAELRRVQRGEIPVNCNVTLAKRSLHEVDHLIDRHGWLFHAATALVVAGAVGLLARVAWGLAIQLAR